MTAWRRAGLADIPAIVALNNLALPAVSHLDETSAAHLLSIGGLHLLVDGACGPGVVDGACGPGVVEGPGEAGLDALLLTFDRPGLDYDSVNYAWFCRRYPGRFLYVDRVVVAERARSRGLGEHLYRAVAGMVSRDVPVMCAEVNIEPPNEGSVRFHERLGFARVGEQESEGGTKRVVMLERPLPFEESPRGSR